MCVGTGDRRDAGLMITAWGIHANRAQCGSRIQSIHKAPGDLQIRGVQGGRSQFTFVEHVFPHNVRIPLMRTQHAEEKSKH